MSATTEPAQAMLSATRDALHPRCVVCGRNCPHGFGVKFSLQSDGSVRAQFVCPSLCEGYRGILHGGIVSSLMDGAMTNCLFAHGIAAVTAELLVRFRHPIATKEPLTVVGWITRRNPPLYSLRAEIIQASQVMSEAAGKFMEIESAGGAP